MISLVQFPRNVIIKFPSYQKAVEFYKSDEYAPIKKIREKIENGKHIGNELTPPVFDYIQENKLYGYQ